MSSTRKALVLESFSTPLILKSLPTPTITPGSALVAPLYAWIPPTLPLVLSGALKDYLPTYPPLIPGPSCIARTLSLPSDSTTLLPNTLVWIDPLIRARDNPRAEIVRSHSAGQDASSQALMKGVWKDGTFTSALLVPLECVFPIPSEWVREKSAGGRGFKVRDFALAGYYLLAIGGLATARVKAGDTVIIAPATGKYSSVGVLVALAMGCKVVAAGRDAEKLKVLEGYFGAEGKLSSVVLTGDAGVDARALRDVAGGRGADVFVDYSPTGMQEEPAYLMAGIKALRRGGEVLLLGGPLVDVKIPYVEIMLRELRIRGKFMWEREHVELFLRLIETGCLKVGEEAGLSYRFENLTLEEAEVALNEELGETYGEERLLTPNIE